MRALVDWLLAAPQPWVRLGTLTRLLGPRTCGEVEAARRDTLAHPLVQRELAHCLAWPGPTLTRHNNAKHQLHHLALLSDLGLTSSDNGVRELVRSVAEHRDGAGALQCWMMLPKVFGGDGIDQWCWMICDAPVLAHALLALGAGGRVVEAAVAHTASLASQEGWSCVSSFPKVRGPGRKDDACPYATLLALRALALSSAHRDGAAARAGVEALLTHWEQRERVKLRMFGIGTEYRKLKYPLIWYDVLHVTSVLSQFPWARTDPRLLEQVELVASKADELGRFVPESVWMAWRGEDFAQKRQPSPTLTLMVHLMLRRMSERSD